MQGPVQPLYTPFARTFADIDSRGTPHHKLSHGPSGRSYFFVGQSHGRNTRSGLTGFTAIEVGGTDMMIKALPG